MKNDKKYIGLIVFIVIVAIIIISYFSFSKNSNKNEMRFDVDSGESEVLNNALEIVENNLKQNDLDYDYEKYKNSNIYSLLITVYDETTLYMTYNLDLNTNKIMSNEDIVDNFHLTIEDINGLVKERFETYYNEEIEEGYVDPNECDFECYESFYRNIDDIEHCYVLYVKGEKLYIYLNFDPDSLVEDKEYFDSLKYNPFIIEV